MKRYILFCFSAYYPTGGWNDFVGAYDTVEEALAADRSGTEFYQVVDTTTGQIVRETK